jgi:tRNA G18 (ribose-2'-O)-methylase SpoU
MGTVFQVPWTRIGNAHTEWPQPGMERLKQLGFKTVGMALSSAAVRIDDPQLMAEEKLAIVLGTEGDGLRPGTIANCDYVACIPMSHNVDSLNVAAASAIAFWQLNAVASNRRIQSASAMGPE